MWLSPYFLAAVAVCCFFLGLGSVPLFDLDEGAFTEATREMLETGVYAATYLDGEPRYDKPILFYWLQAVSIKTFGFNEWAFRLPSAIAACLWALAIFSFVREHFNIYRAQIATTFMISCLWVGLVARSAIADALLNLFLCLTLFDIWRHISTKSKSALIRTFLWMGLGSLTKGPIALVVPVLVSFLYLSTSRSLSRYWLAYFDFRGWIIYLIVVCPWLIAVWYTQPGFFEGFLGEHNLNRFTSTRENHGGSIFYYLIALPLILLPLSGLLYPLLKKSRKLWRNPLKRYLVIWFLVIFIIFSFSKTQLPHYILNACVPLFILFATSLKLRKANIWSCYVGLVFMATLVFLPELLAVAADNSDGYDGALLSLHAKSVPYGYRICAIALFIGGFIATFIGFLKTWQRLSIIGIALNILVFSQVVKVASNLQQQPIHRAIAFLDANYPNEEVVSYRMHMPTFSVYRQRITPLRSPMPGELCLVRVDRVERLKENISPNVLTELYRDGGIMLVRAEKALPTRNIMQSNDGLLEDE